MKFWLMKSEPDVFSIGHLKKAPKQTSGWDGVRNYQARNFMREMRASDQAFFYHSNAQPSGIAGIMEIAKTAYPDPTQFDPKNIHYDPKAKKDAPTWLQVDVRFVESFPRLIALDELRGMPELEKMALFQLSRLSVQPVSLSEWQSILKRAGS